MSLQNLCCSYRVSGGEKGPKKAAIEQPSVILGSRAQLTQLSLELSYGIKKGQEILEVNEHPWRQSYPHLTVRNSTDVLIQASLGKLHPRIFCEVKYKAENGMQHKE